MASNRVQSYEDIKNLEKIESVPLEKIVQICIKSLKNNNHDLKVFDFLLNKVMKKFEPDEFEASVLRVLVPEIINFLDIISPKLEDENKAEIVNSLEILLETSHMLIASLEYIISVSKLHQLYSSANLFLEYLIKSYGFIKERSSSYTDSSSQDYFSMIKELFVSCQKIHNLLIQLFTSEDTQYFKHMDTQEEFTAFKQVIILFCKIGEIITYLDVKSTTEIWKCILKLCADNSSALRKSDGSWLANPIKFLNSEIKNSITDLIKEEQEYSNKVLKVLKINSFYLKIILKLATIFDGDHFSGHQSVLNACMHISSAILSTNVDAKISDAIKQHLIVGYMNVICLVYKDKKFVSIFLNLEYNLNNEIEAYLNLCMFVMSKMVENPKDNKLINLYLLEDGKDHQNLLETVLKYLKRSHMLLNKNKNIYKNLVVNMSAFMITCTKSKDPIKTKIIEEILVRMILQDQFWTGCLGVDLWSIFVRYNSPELCYKYFTFWATINDQFAAFPTSSSQIFVRKLLQNLYDFLSPKYKKLVMIEKSPLNEKNVKVWITLGLGKIDNDETAELIKRTSEKIVHVFGSNQSKLEHYYAMVNHLQLISTTEIEPNSKFTDRLLNLWCCISKILKNVDGLPKFNSFFTSLLEVTKALFPKNKLKDDQVSLLLSKIDEMLQQNTISNIVQLGIVKFLEKLSMLDQQNEAITVKIARIFNTLLKSENNVLKLAHYETFNELAHKIDDEKLIFLTFKDDPVLKSNFGSYFRRCPGKRLQDNEIDDYLADQNKISMKDHECEMQLNLTQEINQKIDDLFNDEDDDVIFDCQLTPKRLKLDSGVNVEVVLENLMKNSNILKMHHAVVPLTVEQITSLGKVKLILSGVR